MGRRPARRRLTPRVGAVDSRRGGEKRSGERVRLVVGIDVGGTFTDAVVLDGTAGRLLHAFKVPSTPGAPDRAVLDCLATIAARGHLLDEAVVCHGTTIGTNTLIEKRGARTALVATRGFKDVIELRR